MGDIFNKIKTKLIQTGKINENDSEQEVDQSMDAEAIKYIQNF